MHHGNFDLFSIWHLCVSIVIGIYWRNRYKEFLFLSILFEIIEYHIAKNKCTRNILLSFWFVPEMYWNESCPHKIVDICINMIGYHIGNTSSI